MKYLKVFGFLMIALQLANAGKTASNACKILAPDRVVIQEPFQANLDCNEVNPEVSWEAEGVFTSTGYIQDQTSLEIEIDSAGKYVIFARWRDNGKWGVANTIVFASTRPLDKKPAHSSTIVYDSITKLVWSVNPDNHSITAIDATSLEKVEEIKTGTGPHSLALDAFGNIWVACREEGVIDIVSGQSRNVMQRVELDYGSWPSSIAADPRGEKVYITLEGKNQLLQLDASNYSILAKVNTFHRPRGIAVGAGGEAVFVSRFISPERGGEIGMFTANPLSLKKTIVLAHDTAQDGTQQSRGLPNGIGSLTISPDGTRLLAPGMKNNIKRGLARDGLIPTFETTIRSLVAVVDVEDQKDLLKDRIDVDNSAMPTAIVYNQSGSLIFLALQGTNQVQIRMGHNLGLYGEVITRFEGEENRELAPDGLLLNHNDSLLFVHYLTTREVGIYDVSNVLQDPGSTRKLALINTVDSETMSPEVLRGKQIFYDASDIRMAQDGYISCAGCHFDGGSDGRVWDFTDRGEGLRRTLSLLGRGGTEHGPLHWSANFDEVHDFEHDIRGPFEGEGLMENRDFNSGNRNFSLGGKKAGISEDLDALAAFVASFDRVPPSPFRKSDGSLTGEATVGREIFYSEKTGCAQCHSGEDYTSSKFPEPGETLDLYNGPGGAKSYRTEKGFVLHDVGTITQASGQRLGQQTLPGLDVPTLKGLWMENSFLHDGSAKSLLEVLDEKNQNDQHGVTSHLSEEQKQALVSFLMQLDDGPYSVSINKDLHAISSEPKANPATYSISNGRLILQLNGRKKAVTDFQGRALPFNR